MTTAVPRSRLRKCSCSREGFTIAAGVTWAPSVTVTFIQCASSRTPTSHSRPTRTIPPDRSRRPHAGTDRRAQACVVGPLRSGNGAGLEVRQHNQQASCHTRQAEGLDRPSTKAIRVNTSGHGVGAIRGWDAGHVDGEPGDPGLGAVLGATRHSTSRNVRPDEVRQSSRRTAQVRSPAGSPRSAAASLCRGVRRATAGLVRQPLIGAGVDRWVVGRRATARLWDETHAIYRQRVCCALVREWR